MPVETEALTEWLYARAVEKERMLEVYYTTGQFPYYNHNTQTVEGDKLLKTKPVKLSIVKILYTNAIIFLLFYLMCLMYQLLWNTVLGVFW